MLHFYRTKLDFGTDVGNMGIKQRREREKQEVRRGILMAARELAQQEGWPGVTIRKVAERIEYSPPTIYEYFNSKEEILLDLFSDGYTQLAEQLRIARYSVEDYEERLLHMVEAYWSFAMSNPELFQIMHGINGAPLQCREKPAGMMEAVKQSQGALDDWAHQQGFDLKDGDGRVDVLRALADGLILLTMADDIEGEEKRAKDLMRRTVHDLLVAWSVQGKV